MGFETRTLGSFFQKASLSGGILSISSLQKPYTIHSFLCGISPFRLSPMVGGAKRKRRIWTTSPVCMGRHSCKIAGRKATFHDKAVKNSPKSVNKEPQNLSVKTSYKEEVKKPVLSYIDSPRPMQLSKSVDGCYVIGGIEGKKSRSPLELIEPIRVLMKLREAPWTFEAKETALNRRFSYDGREISTNFIDSHENGKSTSKLKELPRLSLDSRESSMKSSNSVTKDLDSSRSNKERNFTYSIGQIEFVKELWGTFVSNLTKNTLREPC